jgi:alanine dehydrogenase
LSSPLLIDGDLVDSLCTVDIALNAARISATTVGATTGRVQIADEMTWMRVLTGVIPELDLVGYKEFHRVGQRVRYHISLFERSTADMVGIVDGRRITSVRTAATAALAFERVDDGTPSILAVIGSGEEAREGLRSVAAVTPLVEVRVYSPTAANREAFCKEMEPIVGAPVRPVTSVDAALDGARRAYVATSAAGDAFLRYEQVEHLELLASIGSTRPDQRELIGDVLAKAALVIFDCDDARHEPGDVIDAIDDFGFDANSAILLANALDPATAIPTTGLTVFKSIGTVEQDLVLAHQLLMAARDLGAGHIGPEIGTLRIMRG